MGAIAKGLRTVKAAAPKSAEMDLRIMFHPLFDFEFSRNVRPPGVEPTGKGRRASRWKSAPFRITLAP
jgi:hypothetical protein